MGAELLTIVVTIMKTFRNAREARRLGISLTLSPALLRDGKTPDGSYVQRLPSSNRKHIFHVRIH